VRAVKRKCGYSRRSLYVRRAHRHLSMVRRQTRLGSLLIIGQWQDRSKLWHHECHTCCVRRNPDDNGARCRAQFPTNTLTSEPLHSAAQFRCVDASLIAEARRDRPIQRRSSLRMDGNAMQLSIRLSNVSVRSHRNGEKQ
jgi:hypothetical protein